MAVRMDRQALVEDIPRIFTLVSIPYRFMDHPQHLGRKNLLQIDILELKNQIR